MGSVFCNVGLLLGHCEASSEAFLGYSGGNRNKSAKEAAHAAWPRRQDGQTVERAYTRCLSRECWRRSKVREDGGSSDDP